MLGEGGAGGGADLAEAGGGGGGREEEGDVWGGGVSSVVDVPVILQQFLDVKVPQIQFIDGVAVVLQRPVPTVQTKKTAEFPQYCSGTC